MLSLFKKPLILVFFTILTVIFYISLAKTQQKRVANDKQIDNITTENQKLKSENAVLEQKLSNANSEQIIRDEFLMKKATEYVVKIPAKPVVNEEQSNQPPDSNWQKWWKLVF